MQTGWALLCTIQCLQSTMGDNADIPTVIQTAMVLLIADDHHDDQPADNGTPTPSPPPPPSDAHSGSDTGSQDGAAHVQGSDQGGDDNVKPRDKVYADDMIASLVDTVLMSYDKNNDGYVEYFEYKTNKVLEEVHGQIWLSRTLSFTGAGFVFYSYSSFQILLNVDHAVPVI